ncbi:MAG: cation:proton antiporter [Planctomycetes bacterium]|nr:cation:proton antiporter [Planctomycetota bacterium]
MAVNLAELVIICLLVDYVLRKLNVPGLAGMLLVGVAFGPSVLGGLSPGLSAISADLRMVALITILLRAGFELSRDTLKKVGLRAVLFSFVPAVFEGTAITFLAPRLLGLTYLESAILGSVLAAVSPAVVVPLMLEFIEHRKGTGKGIPTLILAGSSIDDVFVIVVYSSLIGLYTGEKANLLWKAAGIPVSIASGIAAGLVVGYVLYRLFRHFNPRATKRLLVVLGISVFLVALEGQLEGIWPFAALLAVMTIGYIILQKDEYMAHELSRKLAKLWVFAEIALFALVGAKVNVHVAVKAGAAAAALIGLALIVRSAGSYLCLLGSDLTQAERLFVVVSYLPKATVQAAIGGAPLLAMKAAGMNTGPGEVILAVAALSILLTAPAGAWLIRLVGNRVLEQEQLVEAGHQDPETVQRDIMKRLVVAEVMDPDPPAAMAGDNLQKLLHAFADCPGEMLPVVDKEGVLQGVVNLSHLKPVLAAHELSRCLLAHDLMTPAPAALSKQTSLLDALGAFDSARAETLPVVEKPTGRLVGVASRQRVIHKAEETAAEWLAERGRTAHSITTRPR